MNCAWNELLAILPYRLRHATDRYQNDLQELRLRLGKIPEYITGSGIFYGDGAVTGEDLSFVINAASRYSLWTGQTLKAGYIAANGGHRIGLCGEAVTDGGRITGIRDVTSLNIRVARDRFGIGEKLAELENLLILGPPGSGKTTLLRSVTRLMAQKKTVCVVDERCELFPRGFETGERMDVIRGCSKREGIAMALRVMGPQIIAVDEITDAEDTAALISALWCGVGVVATAHASSVQDLLTRAVYRPLADAGIFREVAVLSADKHFALERMDKVC